MFLIVVRSDIHNPEKSTEWGYTQSWDTIVTHQRCQGSRESHGEKGIQCCILRHTAEEWINHDQPAISFAGKYLFTRELRSELLLAAIWRQWHPSLFDRSLIILCSDWPQVWGTLLWLVETQPQMSPINQNPRPRHVYWSAHSWSPDSRYWWNVWPEEERGMQRPDHWSPPCQ